MQQTRKEIWEQKEFIDRQWELRSDDLASLYPSQAWCLHRILSQSKTVLDVGFGSSHSAVKAQAIAPVHYTGLDGSQEVVRLAKPHATDTVKFVYGDIMTADLKSSYDAVMGWSLTYALGNPYGSIEKMWAVTDKYLMFDVRAIHGEEDVIDIETSYATYDAQNGERCHYSIFSWSKLCAFLANLSPAPARIEFCSYYFPVSKNVHIHESIPQPFVAALVVHKAGEKADAPLGRLVPPLR